MIPVVRGLLVLLALGILGLAGGCGGSQGVATTTPAAAQAEYAACESITASSGRTSQSCRFAYADGEQFRCTRTVKARAPTVRQLERAGCRRLPTLKLSAPERRLIARVDGSRRCLTARGLRVAGGVVLPPDPALATEPDGEILIDASNLTFVAFYIDAARARRLAPAIVRNAARTHALVERRGTQTIVWTRAPAGGLRAAVAACVPG